MLKTQDDYKKYFINNYCNANIFTYSGIEVKFYPDQFEHSFFESENHKKRDKSLFSLERAQRMTWIKETLQNPNAELYVGWDREKKKYNEDRRISIITPENYVVVLNIINDKKAKFITAYLASKTNAKKIRSAPIWERG